MKNNLIEGLKGEIEEIFEINNKELDNSGDK